MLPLYLPPLSFMFLFIFVSPSTPGFLFFNIPLMFSFVFSRVPAFINLSLLIMSPFSFTLIFLCLTFYTNSCFPHGFFFFFFMPFTSLFSLNVYFTIHVLVCLSRSAYLLLSHFPFLSFLLEFMSPIAFLSSCGLYVLSSLALHPRPWLH